MAPHSTVSIIVLLAGSWAAFAQPAKNDEPASGGRHALLVGCTKYPNLAEKFQLQGPANDVVLVRQTLTKYFRFTDADIVTLSEKEGEKRADLLPTRANIEREFKRLAKAVKTGDYVFIVMGGHGSQQPESGRGEPEPDGLDEIFLPRDVGKWDDKAGSVANAIVDKDFGEWLKAIQDKKASVCIIFDACHSGTMTRDGNGAERMRQVDPLNDLQIPKKAIDVSVEKARQREAAKPTQSRGVGRPIEPSIKFAENGGLVAIAAAQPNEPTLERELPLKAKDAKPYGLLSYTMCQVLTQAAETGAPPLTYRELAQRVHQHYVAMGRTFPTPVIEGGDMDREILGSKVWAGRSGITLRKGEEGLKINAGSLQGLTFASILAVQPPIGQGEKTLGYVRIKDVRFTESDVEPVEFKSMKPVNNLPVGGVCKVEFVDYGDMKLRVAVDAKDDAGVAVAPERRKALIEVCRKLSGPDSLIEAVNDVKQASWIVRPFGAERIILVPAAGWAGSTTAWKDAAFGPAKIDDQLGPWLNKSLMTIARAENLKAIVSRGAEEAGDGSIKIDAELTINQQVVKWPDPNIVLFDGDKVQLRLGNTGRTGVDVTVLYLDSAYAIDCLFPQKSEGTFNRLLATEKTAPLKFTASSKTVGQEHLLIIAVKAERQIAVDYGALAQPGLERLKDGIKARGGSPLDRLLLKGAFADGSARGLSRDPDEAPQTMKIISWQVRPEKRPAPAKK